MQTKLTKNVQMILVTLLIIVITTVAIGILSSDDVMAYSTHNLKAVDFIKTEFYMSHTTYYVCIDIECDYKTEKTENCKLVNFKKVNNENHEAQCKECLDWYDLPHVDNDKNGKCDDCLYSMSNSNGNNNSNNNSNSSNNNTTNNGSHICLDNSKEKIVIFDYAYHDYYAICQLCENPVPDWQKREAHNFGEFTPKGSNNHSAKCKICGYEVIENHYYQNGKCECGEEVIELEIKSEIYKLDDTYISNVESETKVAEFKTNLETNAIEIKIYDENNKVLGNSDKIGTGMKLELKREKQVKTFTIIVVGDVNGDGNADLQDILTINRTRLNISSLDKAYELAADVTEDGEVDAKDIFEINKVRLNKD